MASLCHNISFFSHFIFLSLSQCSVSINLIYVRRFTQFAHIQCDMMLCNARRFICVVVVFFFVVAVPVRHKHTESIITIFYSVDRLRHWFISKIYRKHFIDFGRSSIADVYARFSKSIRSITIQMSEKKNFKIFSLILFELFSNRAKTSLQSIFFVSCLGANEHSIENFSAETRYKKKSIKNCIYFKGKTTAIWFNIHSRSVLYETRIILSFYFHFRWSLFWCFFLFHFLLACWELCLFNERQ